MRLKLAPLLRALPPRVRGPYSLRSAQRVANHLISAIDYSFRYIVAEQQAAFSSSSSLERLWEQSQVDLVRKRDYRSVLTMTVPD